MSVEFEELKKIREAGGDGEVGASYGNLLLFVKSWEIFSAILFKFFQSSFLTRRDMESISI